LHYYGFAVIGGRGADRRGLKGYALERVRLDEMKNSAGAKKTGKGRVGGEEGWGSVAVSSA